MDIRSIGDVVAHNLVMMGLVSNVSDLYTLKDRYTVDELVYAMGEGYGVRSIEKMLSAIENSKQKPFANVLAGLSIPNVGKVLGRQLASAFKNIDKLIDCKYNELMSLDGIGEIMADDICWWFSAPYNVDMCQKLKGCGLQMELVEEVKQKTEDRNTKVCFTGKSFKFKGDEVEEYLKENGFTIAGVSKSLNYLIVGEKPGMSKIKKAVDAGVEIISESDFYNKFNL
jgi:DNA ligase (NAD+)